MKFKLIFPLVLLLVILLSACMTPIAPTATVTPTMTATATLTSTPTDTPTPTATPNLAPGEITQVGEETPEPTTEEEVVEEPTATPEAQVPEISLEEAIADLGNLSPESQQYLLRDMREQFQDGGLEQGDELFAFFCVSGDNIEVFNEPIETYPGAPEIYVATSCQYVDANGNEQMIYIPIFTALVGEKEGSYQIAGYKPNVKIYEERNISKERFEETLTKFQIDSSEDKDTWSKSHLGKAGYSGVNHIFRLIFVNNDESSKEFTSLGYMDEVVKEKFLAGSLAKFIETGDPSFLPEFGGKRFIFPKDFGLENIYGAEQKRNSDS